MTLQTISTERIGYLRRKMKEGFDWTDKELDSFSPEQWRRLDRTGRLKYYKVIAEVVWADHCGLKPKEGDKFVFAAGAMLLPEETTFPVLCLWAMARLFPISLVIMDRIAGGLDPNDLFLDHVKCSDTGMRCGGLGEVLFKIYCEKVPAGQHFRLPYVVE